MLPPGDVLKCALALARNEGEARRLLLSRIPALENGRLAGHTGGNLLLSMMEQYSSTAVISSRLSMVCGLCSIAADGSGRFRSSTRRCVQSMKMVFARVMKSRSIVNRLKDDA